MSTRVSHKKSRFGCTLCKARRIKCDQRKPGCVRCEEYGSNCPGYPLNVRWAPANQLQAKKSAPSRSPEGINAGNKKPKHNSSHTPTETSGVLLSEGADDSERNGDSHTDPTFSFLDDLESVLSPVEVPAESQSPSWLSFEGTVNHMDSLDPQLAMPFSTFQFPDFNSTGSLDQISMDAPDEEQPGRHWQSGSEDFLESTDSVTQIPLSWPRRLTNRPTALSDYFIQEVIPLYCTWDSKHNYMRVLMESSWQSSEILFHTMQSMAAACLAKTFPDLGSVAVRERALALQGFDNEYPSSLWHQKDTILMAGVLLGHTASWYNPSDLELEKFLGTQQTIRNWVPDSRTAVTFRFFKSAVEYWELLLSFFTETFSTADHASGFTGPSQPGENLPHPFTGISDETMSLVARVGRLIYDHRKRRSTNAFVTEELLDFFRKDIRQARHIERRLLAYKAPKISEMIDPEDQRTTLAHLSKLDEAYICSGLLQLYRVFPDLLCDRYNPWDAGDLYDARPACKKPTRRERDAWLTSLAMYTLDLLREIPFESRTRCIQPFIFVAVAGELRIGTQAVMSMDTDNNEARSHGNDAIKIASARSFITGRLSAYRDVLPLRKVMNVSELVQHTWAALDAGKDNVYWLDICVERRLSTLFG